MEHALKHWRYYGATALFLCSELVLFGAAEGPTKAHWILAGSVFNALLALGFAL
jgi:hypothetical protein